MEFEVIPIKEVEEVNILLNKQEFVEALTQIGFEVNTSGLLVDKETNEIVKSENGNEIKVSHENQLALYKGSYHFVRNIAELSSYLANNNKLKFTKKE